MQSSGCERRTALEVLIGQEEFREGESRWPGDMRQRREVEPTDKGKDYRRKKKHNIEAGKLGGRLYDPEAASK
jgi:hypothetical protein